MNHPIAGPVFSGPHEQPFICETDALQARLRRARSASRSTRTARSRRASTTTTARPPAAPSSRWRAPDRRPPISRRPRPLDGADGSVHRARSRPARSTARSTRCRCSTIPAPSARPIPGRSPPGWNRRLIYTHGGGCTNGWYRQGATTGGVDDDVMLRQGYAVASASLNVFGNNCNDLLASETMMMVKERFVEAYGAPKFTIGWGCSGGSYQQLQTADNYPGPARRHHSVPHVSRRRLRHDAGHHRRAAAQPLLQRRSASVPFSDEQKQAVVGFVTLATMVNVDKDGGGPHSRARSSARRRCRPRCATTRRPTRKARAATSTITRSTSTAAIRRPASRGGRSTTSAFSTAWRRSTPGASARSSSST